jgi:hypothetical protein
MLLETMTPVPAKGDPRIWLIIVIGSALWIAATFLIFGDFR